jgi:c-di-GMP-binding flagellar brake protein YcgR
MRFVRIFSGKLQAVGMASETTDAIQREITEELNSFSAINEVLQVQMLDGEDTSSYYSRISDISDGRLIITWPTRNGIRLLARRDQMLEFSYLRDGTPYAFNGMVDETDPGPLSQITIIVSTGVTRVQRRQNFRVKCLVPVEITGEFKNDPTDDQSVMHIIRTTTYDLSASGFSVLHEKKIPEDAILDSALSLPDDGPLIKVPCRVIYSESRAENAVQYRTGFLFLQLSETERARVVRFVYSTQLKCLRS